MSRETIIEEDDKKNGEFAIFFYPYRYLLLNNVK